MPYKDPQTQKDAQRRSYLKNRKRIAARNRKNRSNRAEYVKGRRDELRDFIRGIKNAPCVDCGESYPYYVMEFDHVRGEKVGQIRDLMTHCYAKETILEE